LYISTSLWLDSNVLDISLFMVGLYQIKQEDVLRYCNFTHPHHKTAHSSNKNTRCETPLQKALHTNGFI